MTPLKILAIVLMLGGGLGIAYGGFSYTEETHKAEIGSLEVSITDQQSVNVPKWLSIFALAGGLGLLVFDSKKS